MKPPPGFDDVARAPEGEPDHINHRQRLKQRFIANGVAAVADYELLELVLFSAIPRRDVKPLANALIKRFGSFAEVMTARPDRLREVNGVGDAVITALKIVEAAAQKVLRGSIGKRTVLASWSAVVEYCRAAMAFVEREEFRVLFLDKRNVLILDEVLGVGTVDHTPVYPREIVKRALELSATAIILVHNHPSGDTTPSSADIAMTHQIMAIGKPMGIEVHDHLIVGRNGHTSLRTRADWRVRP